MKIKEICEKTGLTDRTVRYYIEEGLVSPFYTENYLGRKSFDFSDADLERLKAIATLRSFSFTVEEIKELFSKGVVGTEIVETVKKRTQANLDDSQRCLSVLSGLDLSKEADILTLAQTLYDSDAAIRNETVMPNPKKRILSFAKSCALFLVVWLPVLVAAGVMIVKFCTLHTPVVRPTFFVATLLCFLPSLLTALIFKKSKKTRKILPALLMSLCVLALPVGAILSSQSVMICHHSYEAYHTVKEASCSREGERVLKCKDCGDLRTQAISRLPHTEQILAPRAPTCALEGLGEGKICSLCGEITMPQAVIPKTDDHTTVIDAAVPATCKDTGLTEGSHCSVCNKVLVAQTVIPKTEEHAVVTDKGVAATCKSTGLTEGSHCSVCDKVLVAQTVIPKNDNHSVVTDKAVAATCKNTGRTEGSHCSRCGKVFVAQKTIPMKSHKPVTDAAVPATCKNTGLTEGSHCAVCSKILVKQTEVPKTANHSFASYQCSLCKLKVIEYGNADGSIAGGNDKVKYYITGDLENYKDFEIVVYGSGEMPDFSQTSHPMWQEYLHHTVKIRIENGITSIGKYAFYCPSSITACNFMMSDTVKTIKSNAISLKIRNLTLGNGVETVESNGFGNVDSIYIPRSVKRLYLSALGNETYFYEGSLEEFYQIQMYVYNRAIKVKDYIAMLDDNFISNIHIYVQAKNISDRSHYWR